MDEYFDLYDYRCRVANMYRERRLAIEVGDDAQEVRQRFLKARNELFANHPQSALDKEQQRHFTGLRYFPYNPALCVPAKIDTQIEPRRLAVAMNADESMTMTTVARLHFEIAEQPVTLFLYWLNI